MKNKLTIMADYCATGIWFNGISVDIDDTEVLPRNIILLKRKLDNWQYEYELFQMYKKNKIQMKILENSYKYNKWINQGRNIAKQLKKLVGSRFAVEYFNEKEIKRELISFGITL